MRSVHHLTAGTQEPSELKRIRDSFVARHTCSSERIFVKRSLTDALAATARCTTPAGRFVIPHRHKAFRSSHHPTNPARGVLAPDPCADVAQVALPAGDVLLAGGGERKPRKPKGVKSKATPSSRIDGGPQTG